MLPNHTTRQLRLWTHAGARTIIHTLRSDCTRVCVPVCRKVELEARSRRDGGALMTATRSRTVARRACARIRVGAADFRLWLRQQQCGANRLPDDDGYCGSRCRTGALPSCCLITYPRFLLAGFCERPCKNQPPLPPDACGASANRLSNLHATLNRSWCTKEADDKSCIRHS